MKPARRSRPANGPARARCSPRKIIVQVAVSADGYIARPDGNVDWLDRPMPKGGYGLAAFARSIDTILWGRKTYDFAVKMGGLGPFGKIKHYGFSRRPPADPLPGMEFVTEPIPEFAARLRAAPGKNIWMMGGAGIIASFLDAGAIGEFSLHVIPVLIGEGIPLVAPCHRNLPLALIATRAFPDGVVHLHYRVAR